MGVNAKASMSRAGVERMFTSPMPTDRTVSGLASNHAGCPTRNGWNRTHLSISRVTDMATTPETQLER